MTPPAAKKWTQYRPLSTFLAVLALACGVLLPFPAAAWAVDGQGTEGGNRGRLSAESTLPGDAGPKDARQESTGVAIAELAAGGSDFDGQAVWVVGEAVGDLVNAGSDKAFSWVLLTSLEEKSNIAVTVYMRQQDTEKVDRLGRYGIKGTTLRVEGTFHLVCPEHEGISDLHAVRVSVVEEGSQTKEAFDAGTFLPGAVVVTVGLALLGGYYLLRERRR
ncbi:MAG: hypothetical protein FWG23_08320 [Eggerthellaceae bacterium]|nr:hypothetical protein [Eggerthellaceae bacterium]MDR2716220.1 hypothetical protein [Coriobacteriaceae bacterium]